MIVIERLSLDVVMQPLKVETYLILLGIIMHHAHHPCCIYAGFGNINNDYDALVLGAKLQMKLFGTVNQHLNEKWLLAIKWRITSNNRAFAQDPLHVACS